MCHQAPFDSPYDDLCARGKAELVQDVVDVCLDGSFRHDQRVGNLAVGFALGNEPHDLAFTLRKPAKGFFSNTVRRMRFFPGKRGERGAQEVFVQIVIINRLCQRVDLFSRGSKVVFSQVFLPEVAVLSSQRTMDLSEEGPLLASHSAAPGFL